MATDADAAAVLTRGNGYQRLGPLTLAATFVFAPVVPCEDYAHLDFLVIGSAWPSGAQARARFFDTLRFPSAGPADWAPVCVEDVDSTTGLSTAVPYQVLETVVTVDGVVAMGLAFRCRAQGAGLVLGLQGVGTGIGEAVEVYVARRPK